jgi:hypothetical protein
VLVFATSDKGGTGRSVTVSNVAYRRALLGTDVCYLDFDFGSPTSGAIFGINAVARGSRKGGLHTYLQGGSTVLDVQDIWTASDRQELRELPLGAGRLVLYPGDSSGGEFAGSKVAVERCVNLFLAAEEEFDLCLVDLSAGRSYATDIVLAALRSPKLRHVEFKWLIFHRWTRQHIIATAGLVYGERGILDKGEKLGFKPNELQSVLRFVRTAVVDPDSPELSGLRPSQGAWLRRFDRELQELAGRHRLGRTAMLGSVPLDPVLQWREQLILDDDVSARQVANRATVVAFEDLAEKLFDKDSWEGL